MPSDGAGSCPGSPLAAFPIWPAPLTLLPPARLQKPGCLVVGARRRKLKSELKCHATNSSPSPCVAAGCASVMARSIAQHVRATRRPGEVLRGARIPRVEHRGEGSRLLPQSAASRSDVGDEIDWMLGEEGAVCACCLRGDSTRGWGQRAKVRPAVSPAWWARGGGGGCADDDNLPANYARVQTAGGAGEDGEGSPEEDEDEDIEDADSDEEWVENEETEDGDGDVLDDMNPDDLDEEGVHTQAAGAGEDDEENNVDLEVARPATACSRPLTSARSSPPHPSTAQMTAAPETSPRALVANASAGARSKEGVAPSQDEGAQPAAVAVEGEAEKVGLEVAVEQALERRPDGLVSTNSTCSTDVVMRRCGSWLHRSAALTCCPGAGLEGAVAVVKDLDIRRPGSRVVSGASSPLSWSRTNTPSTVTSRTSTPPTPRSEGPGSPGAGSRGWVGLRDAVRGACKRGSGDGKVTRKGSEGRLERQVLERAERDRGRDREREEKEQDPGVQGGGARLSAAQEPAAVPCRVMEAGCDGAFEAAAERAAREDCEPYEFFEHKLRFLVNNSKWVPVHVQLTLQLLPQGLVVPSAPTPVANADGGKDPWADLRAWQTLGLALSDMGPHRVVVPPQARSLALLYKVPSLWRAAICERDGVLTLGGRRAVHRL